VGVKIGLKPNSTREGRDSGSKMLISVTGCITIIIIIILLIIIKVIIIIIIIIIIIPVERRILLSL
jgi:Flp pilus assembly protein TadB